MKLTDSRISLPRGSQIELNKENALILLCDHLEIAQRRGAFTLTEAAGLKTVVDQIGGVNGEVNAVAIENASRALHVAQAKGALTLMDAYNVHKILSFLENSLNSKSDKDVTSG